MNTLHGVRREDKEKAKTLALRRTLLQKRRTETFHTRNEKQTDYREKSEITKQYWQACRYYSGHGISFN